MKLAGLWAKGSSYVSQFNEFGRLLQIYAHGGAEFRKSPDDILLCQWCRPCEII
jgi:hypothetical protein